MTAVLELNDCALTLSPASGEQVSSPTCAVVDGNALLLGEQAVARSRLDPRKTFDRFWQDLDQQPLSRPAANARNHADIAWYHLKHLWQLFVERHGADHDVILAVPSSFDRERLALLLGIAQACEISVVGLVDSAICSNTNVSEPEDRLLLDISLHRLSATKISAADELSVSEHKEIARQGLTQMQEKWLHAVAEIFVRETRFDPLHEATTEQQLFDQLPSLLNALAKSTVTSVELPAGPRVHRAEINRETLTKTVRDLYQPLIDAAKSHRGVVVITERLARLPGLVSLLEDVCTIKSLKADDLSRAACAHADLIISDPQSPAWVTRLPLRKHKPTIGDARGDASPAQPSQRNIGTAVEHAAIKPQPAPNANTPIALLWRWQLWNFSENSVSLGEPPKTGRQPGCSSVTLENGVATLVHNPDQPVWRNRQRVSEDCPLALGDSLQLSEHGDEIRLVGNGQT